MELENIVDTNNEARRILLVEDEKTISDAVAAYLERENYWVTAAYDGQEAIEQFANHSFDLVILDLMLPKVPGEKVCRVIRDQSDIPIIMLTAKGEVEDRIIGLELGADDYLVKPVGRIVLGCVWALHILYFLFGIKTIPADAKEPWPA